MKQKRPLLILLAAVAIVVATWSYVLLQNPAQQTLDQRVRQVAAQLKCPVCQGESVADSPSLISQQMRGVIRQQLQAGKSEQEVIAYFQARYGDQIVWSPPWQGFSLLAWLVPIVSLLAGACLIVLVLRDWRTLPAPAESSSDDAELADIDEADLADYRLLLEQDLADDDPIFAQHTGMEAS